MILITGATGFIGRNIVARFMDEGLPIRCLLAEEMQRHLPWDAEHENAPEVITGTLMDEEILFSALSGVHTIIHLQSAQWWGRQRDLERTELVGTRHLISAARSARIGRIIALSHLGAAPSSAFTLLRIKGVFEELLRNSGLAYTILRAGIIFGPGDAFISHIIMMLRLNPFFFAMPGRGETILHPLYIDDLVEAVFRSLSRIETVDETLDIGGPEYLTFEDLLRTVMRVSGSYRTIISVTPYLIRWRITLSRIFLRRTLMTQQWLDILAANRTARIGNIYEYFDFHPRRFEDTLLTYVPGQHYSFPGLRYVFRRRPRGL